VEGIAESKRKFVVPNKLANLTQQCYGSIMVMSMCLRSRLRLRKPKSQQEELSAS